MTTTANRQATFRERQRALGLVPVTVWVKPETKAEVLAMARRDKEDVTPPTPAKPT